MGVAEPVRWGILSTANINRLVIPGAQASDKVDLMGVASRSLPRAEEYAERWQIPRAYGSYEELLADPEVEAVYCASKFGQVGFTRALDHELREQGIRCTNVCPGGVATDFALAEGRGRSPDALPGMMAAEDVAAVVVFVLERPRHLRILETALRPLTEASWG